MMNDKKNPFKPPHEVDQLGYPVDPSLRQLEFELCDIAAQFRGWADDSNKRQEIIEEYHSVVAKLYTLGWDAILDMECELPEDVMPLEYKHRHPTPKNQRVL
jgi:hypothetical protein